MNTNKPKNISHKVSAIASATTILLGGFLLTAPTGVAREAEQIKLAQNNTVVANSAQQETLYLNNDKTYSYNLVAAERTTIDGVTVPAGATIVGKYVPADGGLQYVAEAVTYDQYSYSINATSQVIEDVKDPRDRSAGSIAKDAGIGAAGGAILGEVLGDEANVGEIVGGAAAGAAVGNVTADRVVVIEPNTPITLYSY
ncbi:hypothetical protein [Myxosarcina sp. GI1]|uniref:hypothetical protein n=1 Tax=Myxosarcina sp. GI1 TaxID=1541065 RepID=UPI000691EBDC|nr:hypothetical protein [Myxosarcina sp. GI1]